jgi:hypothetical protein
MSGVELVQAFLAGDLTVDHVMPVVDSFVYGVYSG